MWIDSFNSTLFPFAFMVVLSIALVYLVRASRSRVQTTTTTMTTTTTKTTSRLSYQSRRDNRFAIVAITLNLMFLILNMPIVIDDLFSAYIIPNYIFDYLSELLYYLNYSIGFYVQLIVNSEFRREFYHMFVYKLRCSKISSIQSTKVHAINSVTNHLGIKIT